MANEPAKFKSNREHEWDCFSGLVSLHIASYTVPQYGDAPHDQLATEWNVGDCLRAIAKYANRCGKNSRGRQEDLRDLLKIAHYACVAHAKMKQESGKAITHNEAPVEKM